MTWKRGTQLVSQSTQCSLDEKITYWEKHIKQKSQWRQPLEHTQTHLCTLACTEHAHTQIHIHTLYTLNTTYTSLQKWLQPLKCQVSDHSCQCSQYWQRDQWHKWTANSMITLTTSEKIMIHNPRLLLLFLSDLFFLFLSFFFFFLVNAINHTRIGICNLYFYNLWDSVCGKCKTKNRSISVSSARWRVP